MSDEDMMNLAYSASHLTTERRIELVILILSTTLNSDATEQLAGLMVGLKENNIYKVMNQMKEVS